MTLHHVSPPCQGDEPFDAYSSYVNELYADACGRPDLATLLAIEVYFEDADDHHIGQEGW
jgi:hypothetical protein